MIELDPRPFACPGFYIRAASAPWQARGAAALRHRVFVEEQRIFATHDRDEIDLIATHLVALSTYAHEADEVVGTVRIHEDSPGLWWGSRLAVERGVRRVGHLGTELIRLAVRTAHVRGCQTFLAHVQTQNVPLFQRLHWQIEAPEVLLHGVPHARMRADLSAYPPIENPEQGWLALRGAAR